MAFVQANSGYTAGPVVLNGITAGSTLVAWISGGTSVDTTSLPAPWDKRTPIDNSPVFGCLWVYDAHAGGNLSSAITNAPDDVGWSIQEHSGRAASAVEDETTDEGISVAWTSTPVIATAGADVVVAVAQESEPFTVTYDAPFTRRTLHNDHVHCTGDSSNVSAGNVAAGGQAFASVGSPWVSAAVSLAAAGGGAATGRSRRRRRPQLLYR